jgi:excisionase family DNA binding protein
MSEIKKTVEPLLTIDRAASELGVHVWALRRAIKSGTIPAYRPFNGRALVRISEVVAAINASKIGGGDVR